MADRLGRPAMERFAKIALSTRKMAGLHGRRFLNSAPEMPVKTKGIVYALWAFGLVMITVGLHQLMAHPETGQKYHWNPASTADHQSLTSPPAPQGPALEPSPKTELPPYEVANDVDLAPKSGRRILVNVHDPDLTDAQCAAIVARLRPRAGREGQIAVRIPLHNKIASKPDRFFPLCYDNLDGQGVQEGTARQMQRAYSEQN
jgi:hypothetical protein